MMGSWLTGVSVLEVFLHLRVALVQQHAVDTLWIHPTRTLVCGLAVTAWDLWQVGREDLDLSYRSIHLKESDAWPCYKVQRSPLRRILSSSRAHWPDWTDFSDSQVKACLCALNPKVKLWFNIKVCDMNRHHSFAFEETCTLQRLGQNKGLGS